VVSKLDSFTERDPLFNKNSGLLKYVHQKEDSQWLVMDRRTNESRIVQGDAAFIENHVVNCYETEQGEVVAEVVCATEKYLDTYFQHNLVQPQSPNWDSIFYPPLKCVIGANATCTPLLKGQDENLIIDYPTFNPLFKMNPDYQFFYAIAPLSRNSTWFDSVVKIDRKADQVVARWASPGVLLTEFDFVPAGEGKAEDEGSLLSILYNSTSDQSLFAIFDAKTLQPISFSPLDQVVPFHAHGIVCPGGGKDTSSCFTNP